MAARPSSSAPTKTKMPVEDFLKLLDVKPSLEYLDGEVIQKPVTKKPHGKLAGRIIGALDRYAERRGGWSGPEIHIDFTSEPHTRYRVPDVSYWAPGKPEGPGDIGLPPTLAVEIRSPGQSLASLRTKCRFMQRNGVDVCWLVIPETRTVEVLEDGAARTLVGTETLTSPHLPGFALALSTLFAAPRRLTSDTTGGHPSPRPGRREKRELAPYAHENQNHPQPTSPLSRELARRRHAAVEVGRGAELASSVSVGGEGGIPDRDPLVESRKATEPHS